MYCQRCNSDDVSLVEYVEIEPRRGDVPAMFEVSCECRQCGYISVHEMYEPKLNQYR